jgi:hypothetical protein
MTAARVEYLKKTYKKEFDTFWDPYVALCTKHQIDQIDLVSKLGSKEFIGLSDLESSFPFLFECCSVTNFNSFESKRCR